MISQPNPHPALEAAASPPASVFRDTVTLSLFWGCGHQESIKAQSVTVTYGNRTIAFPSVVCSPDKCWKCRAIQAISTALA